MNAKKETIHVLAINKLYRDLISIIGINDAGGWLRTQPLDSCELEHITKLKKFSKITMYVNDMQGIAQTNLKKGLMDRRENCEVTWNSWPAPCLVGELTRDKQQAFLENYSDLNVIQVFMSGRTIGLVKAQICKIDYSWNEQRNDYDSKILFTDRDKRVYNFLCTESFWLNFWVNLVNKYPKSFHNMVEQLQEQFIKRDTYLVIGLTEPFLELAGPFNSCWPVILGLHTYPELEKLTL